MTEEQAVVLDQLVALLKDEEVDVLIIAGDLYDRGVPPVEAVDLFNRTLSRIVKETPVDQVLLISGNHDSPERVGFGSTLFDALGIHIAGKFETGVKAVRLEDTYGPVTFHLVPFEIPAVVRAVTGNEEVRTFDDVHAHVVESIKGSHDFDERQVIVAHGFVGKERESVEVSDSERSLSVGGTELVSHAHFLDFDYAALGHLHRPQKAGEEKIRYAGSLMKYSFSEVGANNGATLVDLGPKGEIEMRHVPLTPARDLRLMEGTLETLLSRDFYEDQERDHYYKIRLLDKGALRDPINRLKAVYPNVLELEREGFEGTLSLMDEEVEIEHLDAHELVRDFYRAIKEEALTESEETLIRETIEELARGELR
jgi:exonuclease SbcD